MGNKILRYLSKSAGGITVILLLLSGCTSKDVTVYKDFPMQKELKAETIELDTVVFRYPYRMRVYEDRIVIMDLHNPDYYYHLFSFPEFEYISSFGKRGNAPDEMLMAGNFRFAGDEETEVWTLDSNKNKINRMELALSRDSLMVSKVIALDKAVLRPLDFCLSEDSTLIIPDYSGENRFCFVDVSGNLLYKSGDIPSSNATALKESKPALAQAWRSFVDYHPRHKVLAAVTQLGEVLEIYNFNDSTHRVIMGPNGEPEFREKQGNAVPSGIMGFGDIQITDKYIYASFQGRTFKDLMKQKDKIVDGGQYIYVFDLEGRPVCKYILDRYIHGIFVDEKSGVIYAADVNSDQPLIYFSL